MTKDEFFNECIEKLKRSGLKEIDLNPARKQDESFAHYRMRKEVTDAVVKAYKKGKLFWNPHEIVSLPKTDENGNILYYEDSPDEMVMSDRKVKLGPYKRKYERFNVDKNS